MVSVKEKEELTLRAEMKIFGIGTLKFKIYKDETENNQFVVEQHTSYVPHGLAGIAYWKVEKPLHNTVFYGMLKEIVERSRAEILMVQKIYLLIRKYDYLHHI